MAQTTVYTCDICKQSKGKDDLLKLNVRLSSDSGLSLVGIPKYSDLKIDICKDCLKKKGFVVDTKKEDEAQDTKKNSKTLEEKIYDILEDMGVAFTE